MNYSFKAVSFLPLHVTRRGISYSWLLIPRTLHLPCTGKSVFSYRCQILYNKKIHASFASECHKLDVSLRKIKPKHYCMRSGTIGFHLNEFPYRCYSQNSSPEDKRQQSSKWFIALLLTGLTGGVYYKFFVLDKSSGESVKNSETKKLIDIPQTAFKFPESSSLIPDEVPYLLIGGGTASFSAFRAIKAIDPTAKVLMVTDESYYPYMRPPLSKELILSKSEDPSKILSFIQWDGSERSVYYEPNEFYLPCEELKDSETGGVSVVRGWKVTELNPDLKYVVLDDGKHIHYKKCLLATGALPKHLPVFSECDPEILKKVTLYRNLQDFVILEQAIKDGAKSVLIVGGGFNGSELACSLARRGLEVIQIYKDDGNMAQVLPNFLSKWVTSKIHEYGVTLYNNSEVEHVKLVNNKVQITTNNNESILVDRVIVAAGVKPNTSLADAAGLEIDESFGGFVVNAELQARNDLYAAGDCACFYDKQLGRRRIEHHDHAVVSGRLAGENMTGAGKPFVHQSMFWSDLGPGLSYEAIGVIDSSLPTISVFLENSGSQSEETKNVTESLENNERVFHKGIIFYLRSNKVVGMIMWNLFNRISIARQVLKSNVALEDLKEAAKLFSMSENLTE